MGGHPPDLQRCKKPLYVCHDQWGRPVGLKIDLQTGRIQIQTAIDVARSYTPININGV